jgi:methylenetetrahydrofolate reductase (NADPH)
MPSVPGKVKKAPTATRQLRIAFDHDSTLRQNLRDGVFSLLVELNPPAADQPVKLAMSPLIDMAKWARKDKRVAAIAVAPAIGGPVPHPMLDVAPPLNRASKKETIVTFSGGGATLHDLREQLAAFTSHGIWTFNCVTGPARADHPVDRQGRPATEPGRYLDSVRIVRLLRDTEPEAFVGAAVNPFKYTIDDAYLQYFKMVKKLNTGANFITVQAGWDMRKHQELQWYLRSRDIDEPCIARLQLLRPDDVTRIIDHEMPGLVVSREFATLLQRESAVNEAQAMSAQIRRLALQAAGCRLFGYSGIQIAGIQDPQTAKTVLDQVTEALETYPDYAAWHTAWTDFHAHVEMAPYPHRFYVFKRLLDPDAPDYLGDETPHADADIPPPPANLRLTFQVANSLGLDRRRGLPFDLLRMALCGARGNHDWRLDKTMLQSAYACPKGLENGPCGEVRADGDCEWGHQPCIYQRILELAQWQRRLELFETPLPSLETDPEPTPTPDAE